MAKRESIESLKNWMLSIYPERKKLGNGAKTDRKYTLLKQMEKNR